MKLCAGKQCAGMPRLFADIRHFVWTNPGRVLSAALRGVFQRGYLKSYIFGSGFNFVSKRGKPVTL